MPIIANVANVQWLGLSMDTCCKDWMDIYCKAVNPPLWHYSWISAIIQERLTLCHCDSNYLGNIQRGYRLFSSEHCMQWRLPSQAMAHNKSHSYRMQEVTNGSGVYLANIRAEENWISFHNRLLLDPVSPVTLDIYAVGVNTTYYGTWAGLNISFFIIIDLVCCIIKECSLFAFAAPNLC